MRKNRLETDQQQNPGEENVGSNEQGRGGRERGGGRGGRGRGGGRGGCGRVGRGRGINSTNKRHNNRIE
jgi:hypothetical protein